MRERRDCKCPCGLRRVSVDVGRMTCLPSHVDIGLAFTDTHLLLEDASAEVTASTAAMMAASSSLVASVSSSEHDSPSPDVVSVVLSFKDEIIEVEGGETATTDSEGELVRSVVVDLAAVVVAALGEGTITVDEEGEDATDSVSTCVTADLGLARRRLTTGSATVVSSVALVAFYLSGGR